MADTIKSVNELNYVWGFYDGDTRTEKLQNPRADLTAADIKAVGALAVSKNAVIGDKAGAAVVGIKSATKHQVTRTYLDLTNI